MKYSVILLISILFVGCKSDKKDYIRCDEVRTILSFPEEIELKNPSVVPVDLTGCVDIIQADSLMICKKEDGEYFWEIYSLNTMKSLGEYIRKGHGRNEFEWAPSSENAYYKGDTLYCDILKSSSGKLYACNLTATVQNRKLSLSEKFGCSAYGEMFNVVELGDSSYFCVKCHDMGSFLRSVISANGGERVLERGNLNKMKADDLNVLSAFRIVSAAHKKVAEGMLRFPQINLYSLDSDKNMTLSLESELYSISSVEDQSKSSRKKYFGAMQSTEDWFGALYYGIPFKDIYEGSDQGSSILFFGWDGTPVLKAHLPYIATSFFVYDKKLYVFTNCGEKESLMIYDCPSVLSK